MKKKHIFTKEFDERRIDNLFQIAAYAILAFAALKRIDALKVPYVVPDEFGYWSAASYFSGYDWSSASNLNPYYAFGYGMVLAWILKLFRGVYAYKAAIVLNAVILCAMFVLLKKICDKLWGKSLWNSIVSLGVCLYTFNIVYAQLALCELLLQMGFFASIFFLLEIQEKAAWKSCIGYSVTFSMLYWIHMRSLGTLAAGCLCLLLLRAEHKISNGKLAGSLAIVLTMCLISVVIKKNMSQFLYGESALATINDFAGQAGKLRSLKAFRGMADFLAELTGQLWYLCSTTFLLLFFAVIYLIKDIVQRFLKRKNEKDFGIFQIYLLLSFFMTLAISVVGTMQSRRTDALVYGRYIEFVILPVLVFGIFSIIHGEIRIKTISFITAVYLFLAILVNYIYQIRNYSGIVYPTVTGIYNFIWENYDNFVFPCTVFTITVEVLFIILCYKKRKLYQTVLALILVCTIWLSHANGFIENGVLVHQNIIQVDKIASVIEENDEEAPVYYLYDKEDSLLTANRIFMLQFLLKDIKIQCIQAEDMKAIEGKDYYVIVNNASKCAEKIEETYYKIAEGNPLILYSSWNHP